MLRTFLIVLLAAMPLTFAQSPTKRFVYVNVTDPLGRQVIGLEAANFELTENGQRRRIDTILDPAAPISIAVVSDIPLADPGDLGPQDEIIQTLSIPNLRDLGNPRKALIIPANAPLEEIPAGIEVVKMDPAGLAKTITMLRNQYTVQFTTATPKTPVQVTLQPPRGLPHLTVAWQ